MASGCRFAGAALCEPHSADVVAGTALCEPRTDFVAGAALCCEPRSADFVAGAALCEPQSADFVAGAALCALRCSLSLTLSPSLLFSLIHHHHHHHRRRRRRRRHRHRHRHHHHLQLFQRVDLRLKKTSGTIRLAPDAGAYRNQERKALTAQNTHTSESQSSKAFWMDFKRHGERTAACLFSDKCSRQVSIRILLRNRKQSLAFMCL